VQVVFGPEVVPSLAEAVSKAGWTQFHVAETEKYAHVTYFFNGGSARSRGPARTASSCRASRRLQRNDLQPTMAAQGVCDALVEAIAGGKYD